jgi:methylenetetrahydrofolate dehydrogenase (NADP+)/methenyltetrahydrofolate cyclohydrolase
MPEVLDGTVIAAAIKQDVKHEVEALARQGIHPGLAVILVGNVASSHIYVRNKALSCEEVGIHS